MSVYVTALAVCLALIVALVHLLRTRRIREKYAAIWIVLSLAVVAIGVFPALAFWLARLLGIQTPSNLVFAMAICVLFAVGIQLSTEVSTLEEETRTLAEEIALLRLAVAELAVEDASTDAADTHPAPVETVERPEVTE